MAEPTELGELLEDEGKLDPALAHYRRAILLDGWPTHRGR
jgi:hypothetical protein